jgi:hypothetical protein
MSLTQSILFFTKRNLCLTAISQQPQLRFFSIPFSCSIDHDIDIVQRSHFKYHVWNVASKRYYDGSDFFTGQLHQVHFLLTSSLVVARVKEVRSMLLFICLIVWFG